MADSRSNRGTLGIGEDGTFRIRFERTLPISLRDAWGWLTRPELIERWLPGCRIEPIVGGAAVFDFGDEGAATGVVTAVEAPGTTGRLGHTWVWEGVPDSTVMWTLEPEGDGTRLTLVHSEVLAAPASDFAVGWHVILDTLDLAAAGEPDAVERAWAGMDEVGSLYQPA